MKREGRVIKDGCALTQTSSSKAEHTNLNLKVLARKMHTPNSELEREDEASSLVNDMAAEAGLILPPTAP